MEVHSLQVHSDLMMRRLTGDVRDHGDYIVVRTASNPAFRWGNYVVVRDAPREGDLARWERLFAEAFADMPAVTHRAFAWDRIDGWTGAITPFTEAGYRVYRLVTLTAASVRPPERTIDAVLRDFDGADDWRAWVELMVAQNAARHEVEREGSDHGPFVAGQARDMARAVAEGHGRWFGAFLGERLVASLGLFADGVVGRYQLVDTHPEFRRRGLAGALLHHAAREGVRSWGLRRFVIVAEEDAPGHQLYLSRGFTPTERCVQIEWVAPEPD